MRFGSLLLFAISVSVVLYLCVVVQATEADKQQLKRKPSFSCVFFYGSGLCSFKCRLFGEGAEGYCDYFTCICQYENNTYTEGDDGFEIDPLSIGARDVKELNTPSWYNSFDPAKWTTTFSSAENRLKLKLITLMVFLSKKSTNICDFLRDNNITIDEIKHLSEKEHRQHSMQSRSLSTKSSDNILRYSDNIGTIVYNLIPKTNCKIDLDDEPMVQKKSVHSKKSYKDDYNNYLDLKRKIDGFPKPKKTKKPAKKSSLSAKSNPHYYSIEAHPKAKVLNLDLAAKKPSKAKPAVPTTAVKGKSILPIEPDLTKSRPTATPSNQETLPNKETEPKVIPEEQKTSLKASPVVTEKEAKVTENGTKPEVNTDKVQGKSEIDEITPNALPNLINSKTPETANRGPVSLPLDNTSNQISSPLKLDEHSIKANEEPSQPRQALIDNPEQNEKVESLHGEENGSNKLSNSNKETENPPGDKTKETETLAEGKKDDEKLSKSGENSGTPEAKLNESPDPEYEYYYDDNPDGSKTDQPLNDQPNNAEEITKLEKDQRDKDLATAKKTQKPSVGKEIDNSDNNKPDKTSLRPNSGLAEETTSKITGPPAVVSKNEKNSNDSDNFSEPKENFEKSDTNLNESSDPQYEYYDDVGPVDNKTDKLVNDQPMQPEETTKSASDQSDKNLKPDKTPQKPRVGDAVNISENDKTDMSPPSPVLGSKEENISNHSGLSGKIEEPIAPLKNEKNSDDKKLSKIVESFENPDAHSNGDQDPEYEYYEDENPDDKKSDSPVSDRTLESEEITKPKTDKKDKDSKVEDKNQTPNKGKEVTFSDNNNTGKISPNLAPGSNEEKAIKIPQLKEDVQKPTASSNDTENNKPLETKKNNDKLLKTKDNSENPGISSNEQPDPQYEYYDVENPDDSKTDHPVNDHPLRPEETGISEKDQSENESSDRDKPDTKPPNPHSESGEGKIPEISGLKETTQAPSVSEKKEKDDNDNKKLSKSKENVEEPEPSLNKNSDPQYEYYDEEEPIDNMTEHPVGNEPLKPEESIKPEKGLETEENSKKPTLSKNVENSENRKSDKEISNSAPGSKNKKIDENLKPKEKVEKPTSPLNNDKNRKLLETELNTNNELSKPNNNSEKPTVIPNEELHPQYEYYDEENPDDIKADHSASDNFLKPEKTTKPEEDQIDKLPKTRESGQKSGEVDQAQPSNSSPNLTSNLNSQVSPDTNQNSNTDPNADPLLAGGIQILKEYYEDKEVEY